VAPGTRPFIHFNADARQGGRYGSTRIDDYFLKHFLSHKLPHEDLELIRGTGGENERHGSAAHVMLRRGEQFLLDRFIPLKHNFKGRDENGEPSATDWIDLPDGVGQVDDPDRNINQGQLGITWYVYNIFPVQQRGN
jgi:hypothetical protein